RLYKLKDITAKHPEIGLIIHSAIFINETGKSLGAWNCPLPKYPKITASKKLMEKLIIQNFISIPAPVFKRELFEKLEGLNSDLWYTADWDLWLQIASKTDAIYLPDLLAGFRIHPNSQTILGSANTANFQQQLEFVFNKHIDLLISDKKEEISKTAKFSILLNVALAKSAHKEKIKYLNILAHFIKLGPIGWYRYTRDSRIFERVCARLIAKLQPLK
ncbi:MAG: hypothetical protein LC108_00830, partial [Anaerolineales bacterium]|nr:hypothetical protein [Anaerolineales bacterium]